MTTHDTILALVKGGHMAKLAGNPLAVLLVYVAHADAGGEAWPSLETISSMSGIAAANHVCTARKVLLDNGLLELVRRTRTSTIYRVTIDAASRPAANPTEPQARRPPGDYARDSTKSGLSENGTVSETDSPIFVLQTVRFPDSEQSENRTQKQAKNQDTKQDTTACGASDASASAGGGRPDDRPGGGARRHRPPPDPNAPKPYRGRVLSAEQHATREAFRAWWCEVAFPRRMEGVQYVPEGADFSAELRVLRCGFVKWELEKAKQVAETYLQAPDVYLANQGRPLSLLGRQIHNWAAQTARRLNGKGTHHAQQRPTAAQRGEYAQPHRQLRSLKLEAPAGPAVPRAG